MANVSELTDEQLNAHVKARVTEEMVEWVKRKLGNFRPDVAQNLSGSQFNFMMGLGFGRQSIADALEVLLIEKTNPENL